MALSTPELVGLTLAGIAGTVVLFVTSSGTPTGPSSPASPTQRADWNSHSSNFAEDATLLAATGFDKSLELGAELLTLGNWDPHPDLAATTFSAWEGLTPEQQAAVQAREDQGVIADAAKQSLKDLGQGTANVLTAVVVAGLIYGVVQLLPVLAAAKELRA